MQDLYTTAKLNFLSNHENMGSVKVGEKKCSKWNEVIWADIYASCY